MSDPLLGQAFNLRHFSPHEVAFLQIVECPLLIQIKNRGSVEPNRLSSATYRHTVLRGGARRINKAVTSDDPQKRPVDLPDCNARASPGHLRLGRGAKSKM
jgi:hypothetical protein